ncbi:MAG: DUF4124 domain-containing protein [Deltaproteobacteria bacterium]|nr:DUF4124 domain-containing protein [Deltaproteobacteria bacterium]
MRTELWLACMLLLGSVAAAEDFYRWTDERGVTHFSNHHPPAGAELVSLPDLPALPPPPRETVEQWDSETWLHPEPGVHILQEEHSRYRVSESGG